MSAVHVERVVTSGVFTLDGDDFDVENNIWLIGDDDAVLIVDAAHDHRPIIDGVGDREVVAIVCTHGHNDHINAAVDLASATGAPIHLHPADRMLWDVVYPNRPPDRELVDDTTVSVAGRELEVRHTPGHSPGGCCLYDGTADVLFSGDTLFRGGPGATGRSFSSYADIVASIRQRLLVLPGETVVHTGHGDDTTIADEIEGSTGWPVPGD